MFTSPVPNLYVSSDGFSVEILGLTGLCYREGAKQIFVDSEVLAGPSGMIVYKSRIKGWDPPHESDPISDDDIDGIIKNIRSAFQFQGFEIDIV